MEEVAIRVASFPEDAEAVSGIDATFEAAEMLALDHVGFDFRLRRVPVNPPVRKDFPLGEIDRERGTTLLAIAGGSVVAVACADLHEWNNRLAITHFYVDARSRRKGIGAELMNGVVLRGQQLYADHLWVETSNLNVPAIEAYRRWGFTLCGMDTALYGDTAARGEVAVFLSRPLRTT
jgi:ribosomal protein S18 acetylase RimI-like enzyme